MEIHPVFLPPLAMFVIGIARVTFLSKYDWLDYFILLFGIGASIVVGSFYWNGF